jgi:aspartyl-tRNA(Asn)/glutamyl-tRNA(Gln) amidotransferase subunit C
MLPNAGAILSEKPWLNRFLFGIIIKSECLPQQGGCGMALTTQEVEHVALLARLSLNEDEKKTFTEQLSSILDYADTLKVLNTEGIEPLTHILPINNVFRADEIKASMPRDEMLANAPLAEEGQYKVPKII